MKNHNIPSTSKNRIPDWVTIREAVEIANQSTNIKLTESNIYRDALCGNICLSIYFQSPVRLRKIQTSNNKIKLKQIENMLIHRLCLLDKNCFLCKRNLMVSTEGKYTLPVNNIIDTSLAGYECFIVQCLLAHSLDIPSPVVGEDNINYGISVLLSGEIFQVFEKITWQERIEKQILRLPGNTACDIHEKMSFQNMGGYSHKGYFPLHHLPQDACFVIRNTELDKLIDMPVKNKTIDASSTRISTPLSRLFWLSCKHNDAISPLINQPYKLLSIFEQWALTHGITDRLSGETLKTALERGSPPSPSFTASTSR